MAASALRKPDWDEEETEVVGDAGGAMPFLDHLDEFRRRLIYCAIAIGVGCCVALVFSAEIFEYVMRPLRGTLPLGASFISTNPAGLFTLKFRMSAIAGTLFASPFVMLQIWLFIAPGLYRNEKRIAIPFVLLSSALFVAGAAFSHYVVFPLTMRFFASMATPEVHFAPDIELTYAQYVRMLFAFALAFQLPAVVLILARIRLVTARFLLRHMKYAVLLIFVAAAVITPGGDAYTQALMALPMLGLYWLGILLAWAFAPSAKVEVRRSK